jgi:mRNA-degrading endonuclease RelE of RelBE toxin-antitoxin system
LPNYRIFFHSKADKFLDNLDGKTKRRLLESILYLENFPEFDTNLGIVKIEGQKDFYRLRIGRIRTMFAVDKTAKTIIVLKISQREAVCE